MEHAGYYSLKVSRVKNSRQLIDCPNDVINLAAWVSRIKLEIAHEL